MQGKNAGKYGETRKSGEKLLQHQKNRDFFSPLS
jgi:hypothetical protein